MTTPESRENLREWIMLAVIVAAVVGLFIAWNSTLPVFEDWSQDLDIDVDRLAAPTPQPLECRAVKIPGYLNAHQLCTMPDGTQCLFYNSNTPTTCYAEVETK